ncbi:MAG: hypothetical protein ABI652_02735 [Acidobacteriota bacterium]
MSEIDPPEVTGTTPSIPPFDADPTDIPARRRSDREGLPSSYRMRADAHYVDVLMSKRADRRETGGQRPGQRRTEAMPPQETPTPPSDSGDTRDRNERMLAQLMEDITTIESSAALLATETSRMARRANIDIIKAQAARASWLLRAKTMLEGTHRTHFRPRPLAFLLGQVRNGLAAECRLNGVTVNVQASDWNAIVNVDEVGLIVGLTGAALATFGIVGQGEGSVITMSAEAFNGELRAVDVSQDDVMATPILTGRFFDSTWLERPGGWTAGIGAATAKAVSQQHGGDAAFVAGERSGSTLRLTLNRASWFESE